MLFSSLGLFFSQREHHHTPSVQHQGRTAEISRSPWRVTTLVQAFVWCFKSYTKRGAKATCCAFERPPRAQAFRAADAGLAQSGRRSPARALGARAAPYVWPQRWVKRIIWSVFDLGLRSQLLLYLFVCNLIFSKLGRWQPGRKGRDGGGGFAVTTPLPNELISIFAPPVSSALFFATLPCCCVLRCADASSQGWNEKARGGSRKLVYWYIRSESWLIFWHHRQAVIPPAPNGVHTDCRARIHTGRQQTETDLPAFSRAPTVRPPRPFLFTQLQIFFSSLTISRWGRERAGSQRKGGYNPKRMNQKWKFQSRSPVLIEKIMLSCTRGSVLARVVCMSERKGEKPRLWELSVLWVG